MRFSSSPLQFLTTHTKMSSSSSRPPHRWPRGFSAQPMGSGNISGDSHFKSVGDANYNARQVYGYNFPIPNNNRPPHFRPLNSKPPDFRNWEYALSQPPSRCDKFVVLSYNILADYLALNHRRELYFHIPPYILDWEWRKRKILFEFGLWSPDIMCLQEVDRFQDLEEELKLYGYSGIWKMRSGVPVDGCAIFWRSIRFKLLHEESIEYNKFGLRDNVAQICVLESRNQNCADIKSDALPQSSIGSNQVVICNTHVLYNPRRGEIKLGQVRMLLDRAHAVSKLWNDAPVVICGDFNCTPKSPLYNFIAEQKLDLTGLARDQMSGQSSAEIRTQRPYTPNFRSQTPNNSAQPSMLTEEKEFDGKHSDCIPEIQNNDKPNSDVENAQLVNNLHQPQSDTPFNARSREEKKTASSLSSKEMQRESIDSCKNELSSSCDLPVEVLLPVDPVKVGDQGLTTPSTACQNDNSVIAENLHGNQSSGFTDHSIPRTLTEHSQSNLSMSRLFTANLQDELVRDEMDEGTRVTKESVSSSISESSLDEKLENVFIHVSRPDLVPETTSFADENKPTLSESSGISSVQLIDGGEGKANSSISYQSACNVETSKVATNIDFNEDQKLFGTSLEATEEIGSFGQAYSSMLPSEVNSVDYVFQSDIGHDSEPVTPETDKTGLYLGKHATDQQKLKSLPLRDEIQGDSILFIDSDLAVREKNKYDPSLWTPVEIMTASGNADCTVLEHPLKLKSTYAEVEDYSGTRDSCREPQVTSYNRRFMGTVDYIWCSEGLQTVKVLDTIPKHALQWTSGFPTKKWGSDHIALASQLAFTKGIDRS